MLWVALPPWQLWSFGREVAGFQAAAERAGGGLKEQLPGPACASVVVGGFLKF